MIMSFPTTMPSSEKGHPSMPKKGHFYIGETGHYHFGITPERLGKLIISCVREGKGCLLFSNEEPAPLFSCGHNNGVTTRFRTRVLCYRFMRYSSIKTSISPSKTFSAS